MSEVLVPSVSQLKSRLDTARMKAARLVGARDSDTRQLAELTDKVGLAKARLSLSEELTRLFEAMQTRAHSRSVGSFEALLSAVLQDVLPGTGNVRLELSNSNNAPNLDIFLDNNGSLEDILEGNGGAVTNVVSTGLRYAALTRTKNRRLIVLDEPDCWIKPEHIPEFMRVISEVSATTKAQTLLISHHEPAYFRGRMNVVELVRDDNGLVSAEVHAPQVTQWESDSQPGLRGIRLVGVRAHTDTWVPLFPGATAFIGDNNYGKSTALSTAIKAVAYNQSDDTIIRHGASKAEITVVLENNRRLVWTRRLKGSPKVVYALYIGNEEKPIKEGKAPGRGSVPDWVREELGVSEVDGLDIQVGSQKKPVFLLDQSAPTRARLLSVGRESGHLTQVMDAWGDIKRGDRDVVKDGEARVSRLNYRLERMGSLDAAVATCETLSDKFSAVESVGRNFAQLRSLVERLTQSSAEVAHLSAQVEALSGIPEAAPQLAEVASLSRVIERLERGQAVKNVELPPVQIDVPVLEETVSLIRVMDRIQRFQHVKGVELPPLQVEVPELLDTAELVKVGERIKRLSKYQPLFGVTLPNLPDLPALGDERQLQNTMARLLGLTKTLVSAQEEQAQAEKDAVGAEAALKALQEKLGGVCPLCDHKFEKEHDHAHME